MKNRLYLLFTGILCIQLLYAQEIAPSIDWQKVYGGSNTDFMRDFIAIPDGYVVVGYSGSTDGNLPPEVGGYYDAWMMKLDAAGNIIWSKTFGGSENDVFESVVPSNDGGYVVFGVTASVDGDLNTPIGSNDFWVTKIDSNGNLIWSSVFGGTAAENAYDIIALQDGNYLAVGSTNSIDGDAISSHGPAEVSDILVVKVNGSGGKIWSKCYGGTLGESGHEALETTYAKIIIVGYASSSNGDVTEVKGAMDAWVIKIDGDDGALYWETTIGRWNNDIAESICKTPEGDFLVAGRSNSSFPGNHGEIDVFVSRLTALGEIKYTKVFGGNNNDGAEKIFADNDGNYIVTGFTESITSGDVSGKHKGTDVWMFNMDLAGHILWQHCYGGNRNEKAYESTVLADGSIVFLAQTNSFNGDVGYNLGDYDAWLVKTEPTAMRMQQPVVEEIIISPNPSSYMLNICGNYGDIKTITIYTAQGKQVWYSQTSEAQVKIPVFNLPAGMYYVQISACNHKTIIKQIIIEH